MQKTVIFALLVIFLVSGSVLALNLKQQLFKSSDDVQSIITPAPEAQASPTSQSEHREVMTLSPTSNPKPTDRPTLQPTKTQGTNLQRYVYPGSTITNQTQTSLSLESSDDTMQIVQWYKETLAREDAQIHNTIVNTVNGKTTATLTVSVGNDNLYVTITHTDTHTSIRLEQK